jgi:hypothetical protein
MITPKIFRRDFLGSLAAGLFGSAAAQAQRPRVHAELSAGRLKLPRYALAQNYRSLKQSSYDRSGGNADARPIPAGATLEVFQADGPGVITHIWFTIAAPSSSHLKENVLRIYWDGNTKPSVEAPVGDFFGLNLAEYFVYQPAFLNCSSVKALNCYFAMSYQRSARISITNQGTHPVNAFYYNIDYQLASALPSESLYFHAQYRQAAPNRAVQFASEESKRNLDGKDNYVFLETKGRGHLMGVSLGVLQTPTTGWARATK